MTRQGCIPLHELVENATSADSGREQRKTLTQNSWLCPVPPGVFLPGHQPQPLVPSGTFQLRGAGATTNNSVQPISELRLDQANRCSWTGLLKHSLRPVWVPFCIDRGGVQEILRNCNMDEREKKNG